MGIGVIALQTSQKAEQSGPPFVSTSAVNGLSVDPISKRIVFGNNLGASTAALLSSREVPLGAFSIRFTGTGYLQSNALKITGQTTAGDGSPAGITQYGRTATIGNADFSYGVQEYSFVTANTGFRGYLGVQSWAYVTGANPGGLSGKFAGYVNGFSTAVLWDGSLGGGPFQLPVMLGYFSGLQTQRGGILNAYDYYASDLNTIGGTTLNPVVVNHYALYAEPFVYATNNFGVYINGVQVNYMGGFLGIGQSSPTARLHLPAGIATANNALMKFTQGVVLTVAEAGAWEYNGTNLFFTNATPTRQTVLSGNDGAAAPGTTAGVAITNFYGTAATNYLGDPNGWASVNINGTAYKIPLYI